MTNLSHPQYRPDIDGLRAIGVLAVVLFHAFPNSIKGGFIGVDVFFVISGYLISTIIFANLDRGTFSFSEFYARRIKRIFPALILVLVVCFTFGWFTLLAEEYKQLGKHIAAGAGFVSNFYFLREAGYFDNAADTKPLIHLWSLGIEEQFYIVWPLLLWVAWKRKFNFLTLTIIVATASFALNVKGVKQNAIATFYSPQTRFWELLSGSLLAWVTLYKKAAFDNITNKIDCYITFILFREKEIACRKITSNALSFFGVLLLAYGFWRINKNLSFPGMWALIPVLGAVLILSADPKAFFNRTVLSNKIAVWFGLISFPLYLWHWPLLSFARIVEGDMPSRNIRIAAVLLSVVLAWLTYKVVERPLRFGKHSKLKVTVLVVLTAIAGYVGYNTYQRDGLLFRFNRLSEENKSTVLKIADAWRFSGYQTPDGSFNDPKYGFIRVGNNDNYKILFVGDSHTQQYWNSIKSFTDDINSNSKPSVLFSDLSFAPVMDNDLVNDPTIKAVVFSYYWAYRYGSPKVNQAVRCCGGGKNGSLGLNGHIPNKSDKEMDAIDSNFLSIATKLTANGKKVFFILDNPFGEEIDPHSMLARSWNGFILVKHNSLTKDVAIMRTEPVRSRVIEIAKKSKSGLPRFQ